MSSRKFISETPKHAAGKCRRHWKKAEDYDIGDFVFLESKLFRGVQSKFICQKPVENASVSPVVDIFLPSNEQYGSWFEERQTEFESSHLGSEYSAALGSKEEEEEAKKLEKDVEEEKQKQKQKRTKSRKEKEKKKKEKAVEQVTDQPPESQFQVQIWKQFDQDNSGVLDGKEMKSLLEHFTGHTVSSKQCNKFVKHLDKDKSGSISHSELNVFIMNGKGLTPDQRQAYAKRGAFQNTIVEFIDGLERAEEQARQEAAMTKQIEMAEAKQRRMLKQPKSSGYGQVKNIRPQIKNSNKLDSRKPSGKDKVEFSTSVGQSAENKKHNVGRGRNGKPKQTPSAKPPIRLPYGASKASPQVVGPKNTSRKVTVESNSVPAHPPTTATGRQPTTKTLQLATVFSEKTLGEVGAEGTRIVVMMGAGDIGLEFDDHFENGHEHVHHVMGINKRLGLKLVKMGDIILKVNNHVITGKTMTEFGYVLENRAVPTKFILRHAAEKDKQAAEEKAKRKQQLEKEKLLRDKKAAERRLQANLDAQEHAKKETLKFRERCFAMLEVKDHSPPLDKYDMIRLIKRLHKYDKTAQLPEHHDVRKVIKFIDRDCDESISGDEIYNFLLNYQDLSAQERIKILQTSPFHAKLYKMIDVMLKYIRNPPKKSAVKALELEEKAMEKRAKIQRANLERFAEQSLEKRENLMRIKRIRERQIDQLHLFFQRYDVNKDGTIGTLELRGVVHEMKQFSPNMLMPTSKLDLEGLLRLMSKRRRRGGASSGEERITEDDMNDWIASEMARPPELKAALRKSSDFNLRVVNFSDTILEWLKRPQDMNASVPLSLKELKRLDKKESRPAAMKQGMVLLKLKEQQDAAEKKRRDDYNRQHRALRDKRKEAAEREAKAKKTVEDRLAAAKQRQQKRAAANARKAELLKRQQKSKQEQLILDAEEKEDGQWLKRRNQPLGRPLRYRDGHRLRAVKQTNTGSRSIQEKPVRVKRPGIESPFKVRAQPPSLSPTSLKGNPEVPLLPPPPLPPPFARENLIPPAPWGNRGPPPNVQVAGSVPPAPPRSYSPLDGKWKSDFYQALAQELEGIPEPTHHPQQAPTNLLNSDFYLTLAQDVETWNSEVKDEFLSSAGSKLSQQSETSAFSDVRMTPMSRQTRFTTQDDWDIELKNEFAPSSSPSTREQSHWAAEMKAEFLPSESFPAGSSRCSDRTSSTASTNDSPEGEYFRDLFLGPMRAKKPIMETMGAHHSAVEPGYSYNPRKALSNEANRARSNAPRVDTNTREKELSPAIKKPPTVRYPDPLPPSKTDADPLVSPHFTNIPVYQTEAASPFFAHPANRPAPLQAQPPLVPNPLVLRQEINSEKKKKAPPVLDGYVLFEEGEPVMVFSDPF